MPKPRTTWGDSPERREFRMVEAASALMEHERARPETRDDRIRIIMRLMVDRRWRRITHKALARVWGLSPRRIKEDADVAGARLRGGDEELLKRRELLALSIFDGAAKAESLPLIPRLEVQTKALRATEAMFAKVVRVQMRIEPELESFDEGELRHFVDVSPEDCTVSGCRVHSEETMKRLTGANQSPPEEG